MGKTKFDFLVMNYLEHTLRPLDHIQHLLNDTVLVKCKGSRIIKGLLHSFDSHLNIILSEVKELSREMDSSTKTIPTPEVRSGNFPFLFIRGDTVSHLRFNQRISPRLCLESKIKYSNTYPINLDKVADL